MTAVEGCICCGSEIFAERWRDFIVCSRCGLMTWAKHLPDSEDSRHIYDESYFQDGEYADYIGDKKFRQQSMDFHLRLVNRFLPASARVLEIGCAHGFFLELLRKDYPASVGVDISREAVAYAKGQGLDVREGDLLELNLEPGFDAVCLWDAIEHLSRPDDVLLRARELLRPGGCIFLTTGDLGALLPRLQGRKWRQIHPPTHLFYFTRPALKALCRKLNFEVVRFGTVASSYRLKSALMLLHRSRPGSLTSRFAEVAAKILPANLLRSGFSINLGDTLYMVARNAG
jgi:SAM-dependent methyltransferase